MSFTKYFNQKMKVMPKQKKTDLLKQIDLTERQQIIFDMKYRQGKEIACIADFIGISAPVVSDEIKIIKSKIKEIL